MFAFNRFVIITAAAIQGGLGLELRRFHVKDWFAQTHEKRAQRISLKRDIAQIERIIIDVEAARSVSILDVPFLQLCANLKAGEFTEKLPRMHRYLMLRVIEYGNSHKMESKTIRNLLRKMKDTTDSIEGDMLKRLAKKVSMAPKVLETVPLSSIADQSSFLQPNQYWGENTNCLVQLGTFLPYVLAYIFSCILGFLCDIIWMALRFMWSRKCTKSPHVHSNYFLPMLRKYIFIV